MHTPDPYYGTGSMMDAAEIPVKQYMPGAGGYNMASQGNQDTRRPGMNTASGRRSSSGVYDDEGLAGAAAIAALYKEHPSVVAPQIVTATRHGSNAVDDQSSIAAEAGSVQNGMPPSSPRQRLNASNPANETSNDAGGFNFPKTLRRQPQTNDQNPQQETLRPVLPLSQRSLRRPHAQAATSSSITSYIRLSSRQPLPTPSRLLNTPVHMVSGPDTTGPAGAKSMRRPEASMQEGSITESAVNLPPPQGAAAAGLMTDYSNGSTPTANPADIPATKTTTPSGAPHAHSRPINTGGINTTEAGTINTQQKPINPYMPQPQNIAIQNDLSQDFQNLNYGEGEGAYISKKTLRHQPDIPNLQQEAAQPVVQERVPLSSRSLRRPSQGRESTGTGFLGKMKDKLKGGDEKYEVQNQQSQTYQQSNRDYKSQFGGGRETVVGRDVDTTVQETINPAVTHEHVTPVIHNVEQEQITRDIHNYDVYDRILPVKEHVELPPRHYTPDAYGKLREMTPQELAAESQGTGHTQMPTQHRERILVSETTVTSPGGTQHTESVWRYPEDVDNNVMPAMAAMTTTISNTSAKPAPSAATRPSEPVRTISRTPHDGDVLVSTPLQTLDQQPSHRRFPLTGNTGVGFKVPPKSPKRALSTAAKAASAASAVGSPMAAQKAATVPLPPAGLTPVTAPAMGSGTPTGRAAVMASPGMGMSHNMGSVAMGGGGGPGIPPPNPVSHQSVHCTGRNDLGPTHHTDIDQRRADTHEAYAGLDSDAYLGPMYHEQNGDVRSNSVEREWGAVPKPKKMQHVRDDRSPYGARPSRPTPVPRGSEQLRHKQPSSARQNITSRMPSANDARSGISHMQQSAHQGAQQRMTAVRSTSQRFVKPVSMRVPSTQTIKDTVSGNVPSATQIRDAAIAAQTRVANSMPETTRAANSIRQNPGAAATYAGNLASGFAAGIRNLMPDHLHPGPHTPHPPGAYDSEEYTHSDHIDSEHDSVSSDSSLSTPAREEIEKEMAEMEAATTTSSRRMSNPGDPPTVMELQNQIIPGGVVKGQKAIVGPAVLMENKRIEEQMSLKRLRRLSQHENVAVNQLTTGKNAMRTPTNRTMSHQTRDGDMATKMRELQIAEAKRESEQSERIQQSIQKNILREEHDEFEIAKQIRREADRALQEAKRTKSPQHIDLAHKLEKEYQESIHQNQRVLKQNYRSGLGVTVGHGHTETTKHHSGKLDGVQEGTGPSGFSPKHSTFPTGFEQLLHTAEGMMGEGTESENPRNYNPPSNTAPNHNHLSTSGSSFERPVNQPRHTTDNVRTNHTVFPTPELPSRDSGLRKSKTISTQPATRPSAQGTTSQRFVKPMSTNLKHATSHSPNIIATQLTSGSHSVIHPNALNVQQHMTLPVGAPRTPTNALELDPIPTYTQPIRHEVDVGMHTQAIPIDPATRRIARDPVHPHTSMNIPTHPEPHHITTAPVKHPLTRTPSQAVPVGAFPVFTQPVSHPADVSTPTQAVPIDPLTHTIPKDPLHFISASIDPIIPGAPSPSGEERKMDIGVMGSPTDMSQVSSTGVNVTSPMENLSKSQKKKMKRKAAKQAEQDMVPEEAQMKMDRAMGGQGSPLPVKEPAWNAKPGANTVVGGVRPMSWAAVAAEGEFQEKVDDGEVKLL